MMTNNQFDQIDDIGLFGLWLDVKAGLVCSIPPLQSNVWWMKSALHRKKEALRAENEKERAVFNRCVYDCVEQVHDYPQTLDQTIQLTKKLLEIMEEMQRRA